LDARPNYAFKPSAKREGSESSVDAGPPRQSVPQRLPIEPTLSHEPPQTTSHRSAAAAAAAAAATDD